MSALPTALHESRPMNNLKIVNTFIAVDSFWSNLVYCLRRECYCVITFVATLRTRSSLSVCSLGDSHGCFARMSPAVLRTVNGEVDGTGLRMSGFASVANFS